MNQIDLFHTWFDRHRDMCKQWSNKEDILNKLNEEWEKDNNSGDIQPSDNDIYYDVNDDINQPSVDNIPMDHNRVNVPNKVHVEMKILNNKSNRSFEQEFPT
ncbi:erythrocyte membrane protein 1 (PfEMP1), exon 2, putative [Plasmodium sp.]|nr:erythrocyte membrane protein 1 (PfEMP1), exon 2, putative [Plasmodium sp.]